MATGVLVSSVALLPGCKTSQTLTEILFDQESDQVDQNNQSRFLRNVLDSLDMTEELAEKLQKKTELKRDTVDEQVVKGKDKSKQEVAKTTYEEHATSQSESAQQGTGNTTSRKTNPGKKKGASSSQGEKADKGKGKNKGTGNKKPSKKPQKPSTQKDEQDKRPIYRGNGGDGKTYGDEGTYEELPTGVQTVVAFDECANMVVSFAGKHALMGANVEFLHNTFIQDAFKDKDIANARVIKASAKGVVDADRIAELQPDAVLLSGTRYQISSAGIKKLKDKKIDVVYLPDMASASHITKAADAIGKMFGSQTLSGDDAAQAANEYLTWHDEVMNEALSGAGDLVGPTNFDTGKGNDGPEGNHTIYVSDWDGATYYATPDNKLAWTDKNGVAITQAGYKWSPMSFYLSAGGTQNASATFKKSFYDVTAKYYVWQFNLGRVPTVYQKNWSGQSISTSPLKSSGVDDLITRTSDGTGLGASNFPYVITRTQKITAKMQKSVQASAKSGNGLYHAYSPTRGTNGSGIGFLSGTGSYCSSTITGSFKVKTNPCGLYSSWIDGSPESVLEATWASDLNYGTDRTSDRIREYYQLFYHKELSSSQVKKILAGKEG
ncbi:MAG: hypothetical protein Q4D06_00820 [Coriobacteriia bacterium]|nr:hypothetical protein [Coriobacteriia bacterium]